MAEQPLQESDWHAEAIHLWANGKTVRDIAEHLHLAVEEVSPVLTSATYNAVDLVLRGGGWK